MAGRQTGRGGSGCCSYWICSRKEKAEGKKSAMSLSFNQYREPDCNSLPSGCACAGRDPNTVCCVFRPPDNASSGGPVARSREQERRLTARGAQLDQRISTWRWGPPCRKRIFRAKSCEKHGMRGGGGNKTPALGAEPGKLARMEGDQDQICRGHYTGLARSVPHHVLIRDSYQSDAESATVAVSCNTRVRR